MKTSFEYIENGDIVYYAYVDDNINKFNGKYDSFSLLINKYYPIIGQFKIIDLQHIKEQERNVSDRWEEPEYKIFPCNVIKFNIEPVDEEGKDIKNRLLEKNDSLYSFKYPIKMDFTNVKECVTHTNGKGTCHNLFLTKQDAILNCLSYMNRMTTKDEQISCILEAKEHNEKELEKLTRMYNHVDNTTNNNNL